MKKTKNRMAKQTQNRGRGRPSLAEEITGAPLNPGEDVDVRCNHCGAKTKIRVQRVLPDARRVIPCQKCGTKYALTVEQIEALVACQPPRVLRQR